MTQRKKAPQTKTWQANGDCGQNKRRSFFSLHHFAHGPTFKLTLLANGLRYRRLGENKARKRETVKAQSDLQKTRRVPAVWCTLCWAQSINRCVNHQSY